MRLHDLFRLSQALREGRDAPLFHGAGFGGALGILRDDAIAARTEHDGAKLSLDRRHTGRVSGVSLTRSLAIALDFGSVAFEIDHRKLSQARKLVPIDYWSAGNPRQPSKRGHRPRSPADKYEAEEFCVGAISPLSRFLVALHMTERQYIFSRKIESLAVLAGHPLLKVRNGLVNRDPDTPAQ